MTLRSKLVLTFVLFALFPLVVIGALGYVETVRALEALVASQTTLLAERVASEIRDRRERLDANLALLAENVETERMFAAHGRGSADAERAAVAAARPYLLEVRTAMGDDVEWIEFRDAIGRELLRLPDTLPGADLAQDDRIVQVTRALPSRSGTIVVGVPISALLPPEVLEGPFGRSGYVLVVDRETGRALHEPDHVDALMLARASTRVPIEGEGATLGSHVARFREADSLRVATIVPLAVPAWTILAAGSVDEFAAPFERLRTTSLTLIALVGVVAAAGFFVVLWRATASLAILTTAADEVGRGNFDPRLPDPGGDEVGRLARAFTLMIGRVRDMMAQVERGRQMAAVGEFANEIAHEIRNPLTSIKLNLQALERGARDAQVAPSLVRPLEISLREVHRLDRVVHGVLRLGRGRPAQRTRVSLHHVVQRALDVARPQLEQRQLHLSVADRTVGDEIMADAAQLEAALLNLVLNAAEATPSGGDVSLHLECSSDGASSWVRVRVRDAGPGVARELRERIFQPFFTTKPGGTGLGLALAQRTAEEHGGRLTLAEHPSVEGRGAEFVLALPLAPSSANGRSA